MDHKHTKLNKHIIELAKKGQNGRDITGAGN